MIEIDPSYEQTEELFMLYTSKEKEYPAPPKAKRNDIVSLFIWLCIIISLIPTLVLIILRLPFFMIRQVRIIMLRQKERRAFKKNYAWDPDHAGSEYYFSPPDYHEPKSATGNKREKENQELIEKTKQLKDVWLKDTSKFNTLIDYASHEATTNHYNGKKTALFILHQLKEPPAKPTLKYEILFWNLHVILSKLELPRQAEHYKNIAIENGYDPPNQKILKYFVIAFPVAEAWRYLKREVSNCWPQ